MNHFEIEEDDAPFVNQNVLGTVIAVNEGLLDGLGFFDQALEESCCSRIPLGGSPEIGFQPQRIEIAPIGKLPPEFPDESVTGTLEPGQEDAKLMEGVSVDFAGHQK